MKKILAGIFFVLLAAVLFVLIFQPELLDRFRDSEVIEEPEKPLAVDRSPDVDPSPPPEAEPARQPREKPEINPPAVIRLDALAGRSVYVNGTKKTGQDSCQVPPGRTVLATWDSGSRSYSHELIDVRSGETVSPQAQLEKATPAAAWAGFQGGPARTGLADAALRDRFALRWEGEVEDGVRSSPVIHGGMAFLGSDTCFVRAVDLETGRQLWSHGIVGGKVGPVAVGDFVFAGNSVGRFEGFRKDKGKLKGTASLGSGLAGLAVISDDLLLASTSDGSLLAIATRKSMVGRLPLKIQWQVTVPDLSGSTATPLVLGDRVVLQAADNKLLALSATDGSLLWPAGTEITSGTDDVPEPEASMSFRFGGTGGFLTPTPAADRGVIYAAAGSTLRAVKAADGSLLWEKEIGCDAASSVSLAWGTVYLGCSDGSIRAFSCRGGVPIFGARLGENPIFASPVLFDGQLLAATGEGELVLLDAFSGKLLADDTTLAGRPIDATPAVWPGGILAINRSGEMACFE